MHIGILKAGEPPGALRSYVGTYPAMIRAVLGDSYCYTEFDVVRSAPPDREYWPDAFIITGSASGVHDEDPWIERFVEWLRELDPGLPLIGICFGHQIMAEAYGGLIGRSPNGWSGGLREYVVESREPWMEHVPRFTLPVAHQDQVIVQPPFSTVVASNVFCPFAALSYRKRQAISFQGHPEFSREYARMLIEHYQRTGLISVAAANQAMTSLIGPDDCGRIAQWLKTFLINESK
jgi:GMP synthase (glutamine-hydrolysing)